MAEKPNDKTTSVIVEGYWICPNCQSKNRGAKQNCDACGVVRGGDVKFYCDDDAAEVTDAEEVKKARAGADWVCGFCGNSSPATAVKCTGCGADPADGEKRKVKDVKLDKKGKPIEGTGPGPMPGTPPPPKEQAFNQAKQPAGGSGLGGLLFKLGCGGIVLLFVAMMALQCMSFEEMLEVTQTNWFRQINIQEFQALQKAAWKDELPVKARLLKEERKVRSHKEVLDRHEEVNEEYTEKEQTGTERKRVGRKDLGNGRFEDIYKDEPVYTEVKKTRKVKKPIYRKEPVYDTWVDYEHDLWSDVDKAVAQGTVEPPTWPETGLQPNPPEEYGTKRNGLKTETYKVVLSSKKGKTYEVEKYQDQPLSYEQFMKLRKGTQWKVILSGLDEIKEIKFDAAGGK
jgi:hypothetical protein